MIKCHKTEKFRLTQRCSWGRHSSEMLRSVCW